MKNQSTPQERGGLYLTLMAIVGMILLFAATACGDSPTAPIAECQYDGSCIRWTQPDWNAADTARARYEGQRQGAGR